MRQILCAPRRGDTRAALAFDLYVAGCGKGSAAMAASLGGIDALVFTGGVGEHAYEVRHAACAHLAWIGLALDDAVNAAATPDAVISTGDSGVR